MKKIIIPCLLSTLAIMQADAENRTRVNDGWAFALDDIAAANETAFDDSKWLVVDLPHDCSISFPFDKNNPSGNDGGYRQQEPDGTEKHLLSILTIIRNVSYILKVRT